MLIIGAKVYLHRLKPFHGSNGEGRCLWLVCRGFHLQMTDMLLWLLTTDTVVSILSFLIYLFKDDYNKPAASNQARLWSEGTVYRENSYRMFRLYWPLFISSLFVTFENNHIKSISDFCTFVYLSVCFSMNLCCFLIFFLRIMDYCVQEDNHLSI